MIIKSNKDEIQNYLSDESKFLGFCETVYLPENESELNTILKKCNTTRTKVTIAGNGTGLTGGRVPEGGIVISMERMNNIIELNEKEKFVVVQPGVILSNLQEYVESKNLFYPPDPTERNCFLGGNVATNASGARTFKYGPTRNFVSYLRILLADGEILLLERNHFFADGYNALLTTHNRKKIFFEIPKYIMPNTKNAAGYYCKKDMDLIDLFIGSEGTLGVITEIKLKLIDLPKNILSCIAFFDTETDALNFIYQARNSSMVKSNKYKKQNTGQIDARGLEYFDGNSLKFLSDDFPNIPPQSQASVWFEQEILSNEDELFSLWMNLIKKHNGSEQNVWVASNKQEQDKFKDFRHAIAIKVNEFVSQRGLKKVGTDLAVPDEAFNTLYFNSKSEVEKSGLKYVIYGHFGNSHMHLNMLPENIEQFKRAKEIYSILCTKAVELKGTISAEHGIGKQKRDYLLNMYGEETIKHMAKLKLVFDSDKILGIGNIFEERFLD